MCRAPFAGMVGPGWTQATGGPCPPVLRTTVATQPAEAPVSHHPSRSLSQEVKFFRRRYLGAVAQLGEHLLCKQGVTGSIPVRSMRTDGQTGGRAVTPLPLPRPVGSGPSPDRYPTPSPEVRMIELTINGKRVQAASTPDTPLLWVLRDELQLTGTKFGCGIGQCGACTVHLEGQAVRSCQTPALGHRRANTSPRSRGSRRTAITRSRRPGWRNRCPSAATASRARSWRRRHSWHQNRTPTDADIDSAMAGNICRCGTYQRIRKAVHRAAGGAS